MPMLGDAQPEWSPAVIGLQTSPWLVVWLGFPAVSDEERRCLLGCFAVVVRQHMSVSLRCADMHV